MKLTEENEKRLEEIKMQISMEREYRNRYLEYALINDSKRNNLGFTRVIFISILCVLIFIILLIIL